MFDDKRQRRLRKKSKRNTKNREKKKIQKEKEKYNTLRYIQKGCKTFQSLRKDSIKIK